jgi:hypothetical protein
LALPDLEQAKTAVLNSLTSASGQRTYDHAIREFVAWYCSEPRIAYGAADAGLLSPEVAAGIRRVRGVRRLRVRLGSWLTPEQGRRLLEHPQAVTPREARDHAMLAMLIGCGLGGASSSR